MAKIVGLAEGNLEILPPSSGLSLAPRRSRPLPFRMRVVSAPVRGLPEGYILQLGESLDRLAAMTLARKLRSGMPLETAEREQMRRLAGVPDTVGGRMLTERIFTASADELGKGGVIGSITHAVQQVTKPIAHVVSQATQTVDQGLRAAAPLVSAVPGIGPAASKAMNILANQSDLIAKSNIKGLVSDATHPLQTLATITGTTAGDAGAVVGSLAQGLAGAPQAIAQDASAIGGYLGGAMGGSGVLNSILAGGRKLLNTFGASTAAAIEKNNPALSGDVTAAFASLGSVYQNFKGTFDRWSSAIKASPAGSVLTGKLQGVLYTLAKNASGQMSVTRTPISSAPPAVDTIPEGALVTPTTLAGLGRPQRPAGYGYAAQPGSSVHGSPMNPAGISPSGAPGGTALTDPTSQAILRQAAANDMRGKSAAPVQASFGGLPTWAIVGLGIGVVFAVMEGMKGSRGPMMRMGQGWYMPAGGRGR